MIAITDYSDHPRKLVTLNPKLKSTGAGRYQFLSVGGMPTASSWPERLLSGKADGKMQQIKERGALPMIDRGDIRQAIDRCSNIWLHCRALVMVSSSIRLTAWIAKFKEVGGTVREIDVCTESLLIPALLSASSSACHGLLIITADNAITYKAQRDKMPEN